MYGVAQSRTRLKSLSSSNIPSLSLSLAPTPVFAVRSSAMGVQVVSASWLWEQCCFKGVRLTLS